MKPVRGRVILLTMAVILSAILFIPSTPLFNHMPAWWKQYLPSKGITLGLDLQGGIHLVLEVASDRVVNNMTELLTETKVAVESIKRTSPTEITVTLPSPEGKDAVLKLTD